MGFKIYTKTGDKGETGLLGGARVPKHAVRIEAYGTVDELNAFLGSLIDILPAEITDQYLHRVQEELFTIGAHLAKDPNKPEMPVPEFDISAIQRLEGYMDDMDEQLDPLQHFILPGGHPAVSAAHVCRTVCRRAERRVIALGESEYVPEWLIQYLNRLSDFFFILARFTARYFSVKDRPWRPGGA